MLVDETRREYVIDVAVAAGKFPEERRTHYRQMYNRDPVGTERVLAALGSVTVPAPLYPRELFPELSRPSTHVRASSQADAGATAASAPPARPAPAPATGPLHSEITDEQVAQWSRRLFPETARR